ncbi:MAG: DUF1178 family protein [Celeribacter sp.]|jgi:hypothetical protein
MIKYALQCRDGHHFDSWFASAQAYDSLRGAGQLSCAICGSGAVEKAIMAPAISTRGTPASAGMKQDANRSASSATPADTPDGRPDTRPDPASSQNAPLSNDRNLAARAMAELRRHVEANSDYVGDRFAREARAMHLGDAPHRAIHGEARPEEARALIEDGVQVAPLPFRSKRHTN